MHPQTDHLLNPAVTPLPPEQDREALLEHVALWVQELEGDAPIGIEASAQIGSDGEQDEEGEEREARGGSGGRRGGGGAAAAGGRGRGRGRGRAAAAAAGIGARRVRRQASKQISYAEDDAEEEEGAEGSSEEEGEQRPRGGKAARPVAIPEESEVRERVWVPCYLI